VKLLITSANSGGKQTKQQSGSVISNLIETFWCFKFALHFAELENRNRWTEEKQYAQH